MMNKIFAFFKKIKNLFRETRDKELLKKIIFKHMPQIKEQDLIYKNKTFILKNSAKINRHGFFIVATGFELIYFSENVLYFVFIPRTSTNKIKLDKLKKEEIKDFFENVKKEESLE